MAGEIIRQGDSTDHGGTVIEGSMVDICHGKPIAYIGHKVSCPQCKGTHPIVEGVMTTSFYGKGVAVAGMKTACGATLIATQFTDIVETGSSMAAAEPMRVLPIAGAASPNATPVAPGLSPAGPLKMEPQKNGGVIVSPPTKKELDTAIAYQKPFEVTDGMKHTRALHERKLRVTRESNNVTLSGNFSVFSAGGHQRAEQIIADIDANFRGLSHVSEGLTYRTDFSFSVAKKRAGADILVDYFELQDDRAQAQWNGQIFLDQSADFANIRKGVGAHEFARDSRAARRLP